MNKQRLSALTQRLPIITHIAVLILATFGPWFCPQLVAVVFFCTNIAFVSSQVRMAYGMIRCYLGVRTHWRTDWWSYYQKGLQSSTVDSLDARDSPFTLPHILIIPSYKETISTLRQTLAILASHPLSSKTYHICLAMECREEGSLPKGELLAREFEGKFVEIAISLHPENLPGELPGKGSNVRWAARWMAERVRLAASRASECEPSSPSYRANWRESDEEGDIDAIITIMDADTAFAADYFAAVSVRYLLAPPDTRRNMMFVPPIVFDRNQGDVPTVVRITDIMWATAGISGIYPSSSIKIPTSAYSMSLALATHVGFWDAGAGAIGEDMHMFCKALFDTSGHLHAEVIYSPASQCNVVGSKSTLNSDFIENVTTWLSDCKARWAQAVRHMWGSLDTGYVATRLSTRDFGVSHQREVDHQLQRVEMRRIVAEGAEIMQNKDTTSILAISPASSKPMIRGIPRWLTRNSGRTTSDDDIEIQSNVSLSSTSTAIADDQELEGSSSQYSYSSPDEGFAPNISGQEPDNHQSHTSEPVAYFSRKQSIKKLPFLILASRIYEAHLMLAHLFIFINVLVVIPNLCIQIESQLARQTEAWGRASFGNTMNGHIGAALMGGLNLEWDASLSRTITLCNHLGGIGAIATVVTFIFHDLYHNEASKRWKHSSSVPSFDPSRFLESGLSSPFGSPMDRLNLGIPPSPHCTRKLPWCFLDYLAVPGALAFGIAPLLYAQVCHLWTNRLAYKVSAKPQTQP